MCTVPPTTFNVLSPVAELHDVASWSRVRLVFTMAADVAPASVPGNEPVSEVPVPPMARPKDPLVVTDSPKKLTRLGAMVCTPQKTVALMP